MLSLKLKTLSLIYCEIEKSHGNQKVGGTGPIF